MNILDKIRKFNRVLTELTAGILVFGIICQIAGSVIAEDKLSYSLGLLLGIILSECAAIHMWRSLDRALELGEGGAAKAMAAGSIIRYAVIVAVIAVLAVTGIGNPLACFVGVMGLKVSAYLQPFTHKISNRIFHETDPVPEPWTEEENADVEKEI